MEIEIDESNKIRLSGSDDFSKFAVVLRRTTYERAAPALEELGAFDGAHVFVEQRWITRKLAAAADDPSWRAGFDKMVAYASSKGWVDGEDRIRAHIGVESPSDGGPPLSATSSAPI